MWKLQPQNPIDGDRSAFRGTYEGFRCGVGYAGRIQTICRNSGRLNENKNSATCYRHGAKKQEMQNVDQVKLTRDYDSVIQ